MVGRWYPDVITTYAGVLYRARVLWNAHVRKGRALKLCQISFHALQSTASETVTFTWPSIPPPLAAGPRRWLNQAQGPMNEEEMRAGEQVEDD